MCRKREMVLFSVRKEDPGKELSYAGGEYKHRGLYVFSCKQYKYCLRFLPRPTRTCCTHSRVPRMWGDLGPLLLLFPCHQQEAGSQVGQVRLKASVHLGFQHHRQQLHELWHNTSAGGQRLCKKLSFSLSYHPALFLPQCLSFGILSLFIIYYSIPNISLRHIYFYYIIMHITFVNYRIVHF